MSKITTIRFNEVERALLKEMGGYLGVDSTSTIVKSSLVWAKAYVDKFLLEFESVIRPLKPSEIDQLITTMQIVADKIKSEQRTYKQAMKDQM